MSHFAATESSFISRTMLSCSHLLHKYRHMAAGAGDARMMRPVKEATFSFVSPEETETILKLHAEGQLAVLIGEQVGRNYDTIKRVLSKHGLKPHLKGKPKKKK